MNKFEIRPFHYFIVGFILLALIAFCSCSSCSESGRLAAKQTLPSNKAEEKVVILEPGQYGQYPQLGNLIKYKVRRIQLGVSDYITTPNIYVKGDTILTRFN